MAYGRSAAARPFSAGQRLVQGGRKTFGIYLQRGSRGLRKKAGSHTTANVHYYVKEREPEPGAVRKGTAQPDLDARAQEEVTPKNAATEKQNEIPGRQITPEPDPLVEIRSAVHSNYAGMVAMLGADNRVYLGKEERYHSDGELPGYYDNQDGSLCFVCDQPDMYYFLYGEGWAHTQAEMLERGLTAPV